MNPHAVALFRELADRSPSEREAYYVRHAISKAVRDDVESLLRFDGDTTGEVQARVAAAAKGVLADRVTNPGSSGADDVATRTSTSETGEGRFPPGTLLDNRYRIVSLGGRGGMGEVYRATDLKLKQPVALKFLPEAASHDARLLARFHTEVRLARRISHPNVCRVYDIGEVDGTAYISMEYIDGENLASLLRRIGRLPHDKALEIARRLCAGLAAAHDKGVVHRDLKPANVMIDSQGQVFITDFGLAATVRELAHTQLRSGTPAYMAPEQLEGREVTVRSDLYALGLVLYEMFTGRPPFSHRRTPTDRPARIRSVAKDIDDVIARTIERCLQELPGDRPASALAVAAALPGGNPLAEALAAGVTPSPQTVAAARSAEALSVRAAVVTLAFVLAGLVGVVTVGSSVSVLHNTPFPYPPVVLEQKARELIASMGYTAPPLDTARSLFWNGIYQTYAEQQLPDAEYRAQLRAGQPSLVSFRYRQSSQYMLMLDAAKDYVDESDPPLRVPGDLYLALDLHGRLRHIEAVPSTDSYAQDPAVPDWIPMFAAAGIDPLRLTAAAPGSIPPVTSDARTAWTGTFAHAPSAPVRVEAASWRGRPVYFRVMSENLRWLSQWRYSPYALASWVFMCAPWILGGAAVFVAWRNHRAGRTDTGGAARLGAAVAGGALLGWALTAHHVPMLQYLPIVFRALSSAVTTGLFGAILYIAVEPYIRRRWPQSLIAWTRLLSGRIRDSLVASHVLVGVAVGIGVTLWTLLKMSVLLDQGLVTPQTSQSLSGPGWIINSLVWNLVWWSVVKALSVCVLLLFARVLIGIDWIATAVVVLLANAITIIESPNLPVQLAFEIPAAAVAVWLLMRWGVLAMMVAYFISEWATYTPLTTNLTAWYAGPTLLVIATVLVLAISSCSVALAGRPLFEHERLEHAA